MNPSLCVPFIELAKRNNEEMPYGDESRGGDTFLTQLHIQIQMKVLHQEWMYQNQMGIMVQST